MQGSALYGAHDVCAGVPFLLLEASDGVGGRVRTDNVDGFLLDRGFQIFLTSYEESQVGAGPWQELAWLVFGACVTACFGDKGRCSQHLQIHRGSAAGDAEQGCNRLCSWQAVPADCDSRAPGVHTPPQAQAALDYRALDLKPFYAGALVRFEGDFHRVADPFRQACCQQLGAGRWLGT